MEISGSNLTASTFALKQAIEMENILLGLIQNSVGAAGQALATQTPAPSAPVDLSAMTGKGKLINTVA